MKETIDIVRKAMKLEKKQSKSKAGPYENGQLQVLQHILSENKTIEELGENIANVYNSALEFCTNWKNKKELGDQELEMLGAADIIAWVLEVPEKDHELYKTLGKVQPK